jgi:hypothetical protein
MVLWACTRTILKDTNNMGLDSHILVSNLYAIAWITTVLEVGNF